MALLLAMFQKMRIAREYNEYVLKETKLSTKQNRIKENIAKTQKRYTSLIAQIDSQAKMMASQAKVYFNQSIGMDMMNSNPYSGMSIFVQNMMSGWLSKDITGRKDAQGNDLPDIPMDNNVFQGMLTEYQNGTLKAYYEKDSEGNYNKEQAVNSENQKLFGSNGAYTEDQVTAFNQAMRSAQMQQQQAQMWAQQQASNFDQNVSIWAEARKAELEAEQDAALEPLNYEDTMMDIEHEQIKIRLEQLKEERESYKNLVQEEIKNSTPSFGLG